MITVKFGEAMDILRSFIKLNLRLRWCSLLNLGEFGTHVEYLRLAALTDAVGANDSLDFRFVDDVCRNSKIGIGNYDLVI
jgi:hypothetical protein